MSGPQIHSRFGTVPASLMLETLGASLAAIRNEDGATWADIGAALGKSEDRAAAYSIGNGDMGVVSFLRGARQYNGRFANAVLALIGMKLVALDGEEINDQASVTTVLSLATALSAELEKDGSVDDEDLERHRFIIERTGRVVDGFRERLRTKAIAAG